MAARIHSSFPRASQGRGKALIKVRPVALAKARSSSPAPASFHPPYVSLAIVSASAFAYEILLTRLLSIVQWPHVGFMIVSVALLGLGASGAFIALVQHRWFPHYASIYVSQIALFALTAAGAFFGAQYIPFNPEQVLWNMEEALQVAAICALLALPFFFAGNAVALTLVSFRSEITRVYSIHLLGAAAGSLVIIVILTLLLPQDALRLMCALVLATAGLAWWEMRVRPVLAGSFFVVLACLLVVIPPGWTELNITPYKSLPQALRVEGAKIIAQDSSPLGLVSAVENSLIPWNRAPGLSVVANLDTPPQIGLFTDGDRLTMITQPTKNSEDISYLDQLTSALPYHFGKPQRVLILGAGGGQEVLQARFHGVPLIDAVEPNPQVVHMVRNKFGSFAGNIYDSPDVKLHIEEPRGYVARSDARYDVIQIALLDPIDNAMTGRYGLSENYLYTVEALRAYFNHLEAGGYLAITRWINIPPRDTLKLFATAAQALEQNGIFDPGKQLILIRGWQTSTLLIKQGVVTPEELKELRLFCRERRFDMDFYPGIKDEDANKYNMLERPYLIHNTQEVLGNKRLAFFERYKFDVAPTYDNRPYFFDYLKPVNMSDMFVMRHKGGMATLEWTYPMLVTTTLLILAVSVVLISLPLFFSRYISQGKSRSVNRLRVLMFFFFSALGIFLVEFVLLQKAILFLHHLLFTPAVVLTTFLLGMGAGSAYAQRLADHRQHRTAVWVASAGMVILSLAYLIGIDTLFELAMEWPLLPRIGLLVILLAPLAFCIGIPVPLALDKLGADAPGLIPWAYGVYGCAWALGGTLAMLGAHQTGFIAVMIAGVVLYSLAIFAFPASKRRA